MQFTNNAEQDFALLIHNMIVEMEIVYISTPAVYSLFSIIYGRPIRGESGPKAVTLQTQ